MPVTVIKYESLQTSLDAIDDLNTSVSAAEAGRVGTENTRQSQETGRVNAELARVSVEANRVSAENGRVSAEGARVTAENNRVIAEAARPTATISASIPGSLTNGNYVLVRNATVGQELYVGNVSNVPVPACGYRQAHGTFSFTATGISSITYAGKNTLSSNFSNSAKTGTGLYTVDIDTGTTPVKKDRFILGPITSVGGSGTAATFTLTSQSGGGVPAGVVRYTIGLYNTSWTLADPISNFVLPFSLYIFD